ncbi:MAG: NAD(P)H-binding protein [Desulfitobacteriaceae bacterium]|nr:NAD(P)H-binding protein [Desulfitobacteriaceae bacterium]MDI6879766.1 NAD(P)H-binding protein [Desulfitobacteriaceae bacterium]MDI6913318.1 NAD(P)H-binding protein [Desulfitobacteriaceae bacterium]
MRVFITGGTGYVGQAVVTAAIRAGHQAIVLQRPGTHRPLKQQDVELVEGDVLEPRSLEKGLPGADAVIHLVGIIREIPRQNITLERLHVEATRNVLEAAKRAQVPRFVHMSALGSRPQAVSGYHRTKWAAEEWVRQSGLTFTIFRPSVIFGQGGPGPEFVGQLADLARKAPFLPIIGDGRSPLQPVSIQTIAEAIVASLTSPLAHNKIYEAGGPEVITYEEIMRRICEALNKHFRPVHIPFSMMGVLLPILQHLPGFPLTLDQFIMLKEGNVCQDSESLYRDFGLEKIPFKV